MQKNYYTSSKKKGDIGEEFFLERHNELLLHPAIPIVDMRADEWHVEGSDVGCERMVLKPTDNQWRLRNQMKSIAKERSKEIILSKTFCRPQ